MRKLVCRRGFQRMPLGKARDHQQRGWVGEDWGHSSRSADTWSGQRSSTGSNKLEKHSWWFLRCFSVLLYFFSSQSFPANPVVSHVGLNSRFRQRLPWGFGKQITNIVFFKVVWPTRWLWGLHLEAICHFHKVRWDQGLILEKQRQIPVVE